jgi:predicted component of type VI protein secretion system
MKPEDVPAGVLTAADLDALPVGARVVDAVGDIFAKRGDRFWYLDDDYVVPYVSAEVAVWAPEFRP